MSREKLEHTPDEVLANAQHEVIEGEAVERREAEVIEGIKQGMFASFASEAWKRVPGFNLDAVKQRLNNLKPSEIKKALSDEETRRNILAFSSGVVGGQAVRQGAKYLTHVGLGTVTGGAGYVLAMAGGGLAGAVAEGVKVYAKERKREVSDDEFQLRLEVIKKEEDEFAKFSLADVGMEHPEASKIVDEIKLEKQKEKTRLNRYLELVAQGEIPEGSEEASEKRGLYKELKSEMLRRKVGSGIKRGAARGAVGGFAGEFISQNLFGVQSAEAAENVKKAVAETGQAGAVDEAVCNKLTAAAKEANRTALEKAMKKAPDAVHAKDFYEVVEKGEGPTHIARKAIHDYISQLATVDHNITLNDAQLVRAENTLLATVGHARYGADAIGTSIKIPGPSIGSAIEDARGLTEKQVGNLQTNWVPKIAPKTWENIKDYSTLSNPENNFAKGIIETAKRRGEQAMNSEIARCAREVAHKVAQKKLFDEASERAAREWFWQKMAMGGGATLLAGAAIGGGLYLRKRRRSGATEGAVVFPEEGPRVESVDPAGAGPESPKPFEPIPFLPTPQRRRWPFRREKKDVRAEVLVGDATEEPEVVEPVKEAKKRWWQRKEKERSPETPKEVAPEIDEAADASRRERERQEFQREEEESVRREKEGELQRKLARSGVPEDLRSRSTEEEERKLEGDPFIRVVRSKGIMVDKESTDYRVPNVEDMDKKEGIREIRFTSYTDYRAYLERMTVEQREWADTIVYVQEEGKKQRMKNIWSRFWKDVDALPDDAKKEVYGLSNKAQEGLLVDEFRNKPEVNDAVLQELQEEFSSRFPYRVSGFLMGAPTSRVSALQAYNGMKKLMDVLGSFSPPLRFENAIIRIGTQGINPTTFDREIRAEVQINPSLSEDQMKEYLTRAVEETKRITRKP